MINNFLVLGSLPSLASLCQFRNREYVLVLEVHVLQLIHLGGCRLLLSAASSWTFDREMTILMAPLSLHCCQLVVSML